MYVYRVHDTQNDRHELTVVIQKINFEKYALDPEIFVNLCQNLKVCLVSQILIHFDYYTRIGSLFFKTNFCFEIVSSSWLFGVPGTL